MGALMLTKRKIAAAVTLLAAAFASGRVLGSARDRDNFLDQARAAMTRSSASSTDVRVLTDFSSPLRVLNASGAAVNVLAADDFSDGITVTANRSGAPKAGFVPAQDAGQSTSTPRPGAFHPGRQRGARFRLRRHG
jgi:hypothetical protein